MKLRTVAGLILASSALFLSSELDVRYAEAKTCYNCGNWEQTAAVFTMIAIAIGGFGIFLAMYTRETFAVRR